MKEGENLLIKRQPVQSLPFCWRERVSVLGDGKERSKEEFWKRKGWQVYKCKMNAPYRHAQTFFFFAAPIDKQLYVYLSIMQACKTRVKIARVGPIRHPSNPCPTK